MRKLPSALALVVATALSSLAADASRPGHLEGYVPVVANGAGAHGSFWSTDLWIYTQDASTIHLWFNRSGTDNSDRQSVELELTEAVTYLPDVVGSTFGTSGKGSLHYLADGPVVVVSKTWTPAPNGGTYGQIIQGIPVADASTPDTGQAGALRVVVAKADGFRSNLGLVNVSGNTVTVTVDAFDEDGTALAGSVPFTVVLPPFDMKQVDDVLARLAAASRTGVILRARVSEGEGAILAYLSEVDNATNSGGYQEAFRFGY